MSRNHKTNKITRLSDVKTILQILLPCKATDVSFHGRKPLKLSILINDDLNSPPRLLWYEYLKYNIPSVNFNFIDRSPVAIEYYIVNKNIWEKRKDIKKKKCEESQYLQTSRPLHAKTFRCIFQLHHKISNPSNRAWHRIGKQKVKGIAVTCSGKVRAAKCSRGVDGYWIWTMGWLRIVHELRGSKAKPVMQ